MAALLDLRLSGPRSYRGEPSRDPPMGNGTDRARPSDLRRALSLQKRAGLLLAGLLGVLAATGPRRERPG